jgi:hypothetical protein
LGGGGVDHGTQRASSSGSAVHAGQRLQSQTRATVPSTVVTPTDDQTCSGQSAGSDSIPPRRRAIGLSVLVTPALGDGSERPWAAVASRRLSNPVSADV